MWTIMIQPQLIRRTFSNPCQFAGICQACKGALRDPATRQNLEAHGFVGPLDDSESERSDFLQCALRFGPEIAGGRAVAILNIGAMNHEADPSPSVSTTI